MATDKVCNGFGEAIKEIWKTIEKANEIIKNPLETQERKDKAKSVKNHCLNLISEHTFKNYQDKQRIEELQKKKLT